MPFLLDACDIDTLEWVLRCYLADRVSDERPAGADDDVRAMFAAAQHDRRAVASLLRRLEATKRLPAETRHATRVIAITRAGAPGAVPLARLPAVPAA